MRIKGWMGRADQTTKVKGMFVHPGQVAEVAQAASGAGARAASVTREAEQDVMTLAAECATRAAGFGDAVATTLQCGDQAQGPRSTGRTRNAIRTMARSSPTIASIG
jgi:phenylacetate-CoA ligase